MLTSKDSHGDTSRILVLRILARRHLRSLGAMTFILSYCSYMLFELALEDGFRAILNGDDLGGTFLTALIAAFLLWQLWKSTQGLGAAAYIATIPLDHRSEQHAGTASKEVVTAKLSEDAVEWATEDVRDRINLNVFFSSWRAKGYVLLENTLAESHYLAVDEPKRWLSSIRQNKKQVAKSGWALPIESESTQHYYLPAGVYLDTFMRYRKGPPPATKLGGHVVALCIWALFLFITIWSFLTSETFTIYYSGLFAVIIIAILIVVLSQVRIVRVGRRRLLQGLTVDGRDADGVTHGLTACTLTPEGIDFFRTFYQQEIKWGAVKSADLWDGWFALRADDQTLATVPDSAKLREGLMQAGLEQPQGPWATTTAVQTWKRPS